MKNLKILLVSLVMIIICDHIKGQNATITISPSQTSAFDVETSTSPPNQVLFYSNNPTPRTCYINGGAGRFIETFRRCKFSHPNIANADITNVVITFTAGKHSVFDTYQTPAIRTIIPQNACNNMIPSSTAEYQAVVDCMQNGAEFVTDYLINPNQTMSYTRTFNSSSTPSLSLLLKNPTDFTFGMFVNDFFTDVDVSSFTAAITYNVNPIANNTIGSNQSFVTSGNPALLTGSTPTGGNNASYTYQWQSSLNNSTWTNISGATALTYDPPTISQTTYYRRMVNSSPATASTSNVVTITITPPITNNTISADQSFVLSGDPAVLIGSTPTGGAGSYLYQWQSSPNNSTWTNISGATAINYDPTTITQTTYYRRVVNSSPAAASTSNVVTVTITTPAIANNTIGSNQTFSISGDPLILTGSTPTGGTGSYLYQWQSSPNNSTWTNISGATGINYDPTTITQTTYYRRVVNSSPAAVSNSNVVTVTITAPAIANNSIGSDQTFSISGDPVILTGSTPTGGTGSYSYQWQSSPNNSTWTNISGATTINYDPTTIIQTTYYRRIVNSSPAAASTSNVVTVTITAPPITNNTIGSDQTFLFSGNPVILAGSTPGGGNGSYLYQWQSSPNNSTWTNISGAALINYDPPTITITTYYRRVVTSGSATSNSNVVTITINCPNQVLKFDGVNDNVEITNTPLLNLGTGQFTFEANIKTLYTTSPNTVQTILDKRNNSEYEGFVFGISQTGTMWMQLAGTNYFAPTGTTNLFDGKSHHLAVTRNNSGSLKYYADGLLVWTSTSVANINSAGSARIGWDNQGYVQYFNGFIRDVRVWNVERSQTDIQNNKYETLSPQTGLVGYWKMLDGPGQTVADFSGNSITGTLGFTSSAESNDPQWTCDNFCFVSPVANAGPDKQTVTNCCSYSNQVTIGTTPLCSGCSASWSPSTGLSCTGCAQPIATVASGSITYTYTVTNSLGCTSTDNVVVSASGAGNQDCCGGGGGGDITVSKPNLDNNKEQEIGLVTGINRSLIDKKQTVSELLYNVPNPSNDKTVIYYNLSNEVSVAEIHIIDISGKVVAKLHVTSEINSVEINCNQYSPGIYFNSLMVGDKLISTKKMIITK